MTTNGVPSGQLAALLDAIGVTANRDQLMEILQTVARLAAEGTDRLDLKIVNAALKEMAEGFEVFAPYRHVRKVTMFGSARTLPTDPLYSQARALAALLAGHGWSTVTGAGPGIMAAGLEGAGPDHAFGINIRLPFEQGANAFIAEDPKLVSMKYFFTRELLLIKESFAYAVLPGGFGTLDEAFELLTLIQTGKAEPAPVVLLDIPGGGYWKAWERFVTDEVASRNLISAGDTCLYRIVDRVDDAAAEILGFCVASTKNGSGKRMADAGGGDLVLLHRFEQRGLRLGRRAVDFVGQDHVARRSGRARTSCFRPFAVSCKNFRAGDVRRHEVGRELDALELAGEKSARSI